MDKINENLMNLSFYSTDSHDAKKKYFLMNEIL